MKPHSVLFFGLCVIAGMYACKIYAETHTDYLKEHFPHLTDRYHAMLESDIPLHQYDFQRAGEMVVYGNVVNVFSIPGLIGDQYRITQLLLDELENKVSEGYGFYFQERSTLPGEYDITGHEEYYDWDFWGIFWFGYDSFSMGHMAVYDSKEGINLFLPPALLKQEGKSRFLMDEFDQEYQELRGLIDRLNWVLLFGSEAEQKEIIGRLIASDRNMEVEDVWQLWTENGRIARIRMDDSSWNYSYFQRTRHSNAEAEREYIGFGASLEWFFPDHITNLETVSGSNLLHMIYDGEWKIHSLKLER